MVEGVNSTATLCVVILNGLLGRSIAVAVSTVNITAIRKQINSFVKSLNSFLILQHFLIMKKNL